MKSYAASRLARVLAWLLRDDRPNELAARKSRWASRNIRTLFGQGKTQRCTHRGYSPRSSQSKRNSLGNGGRVCVTDRTHGPAKLFAFAIVILLSRFSFVLESRNILLRIRTLRWTMQRDTRASLSLSFSDRVAGRRRQRPWKRNELALSEETTRFRFDEIVYRFDSTGFDGIRLAARRAQTGNERASSGG